MVELLQGLVVVPASGLNKCHHDSLLLARELIFIIYSFLSYALKQPPYTSKFAESLLQKLCPIDNKQGRISFSLPTFWIRQTFLNLLP
jgi:hypothetical protein